MVLAAVLPSNIFTTVRLPSTWERKQIVKALIETIKEIKKVTTLDSGLYDVLENDTKIEAILESLQSYLIDNPDVRRSLENNLGHQKYCALLIALEHGYKNPICNMGILMNTGGIFFATDEIGESQLILNVPYSHSYKGNNIYKIKTRHATALQAAFEKGIQIGPKGGIGTAGQEDLYELSINLWYILDFIKSYDLKPVTISLNAVVNSHATRTIIHRAQNGEFVCSTADSLRPHNITAKKQTVQNAI